MDEIVAALRIFQIQTLEALLALSELEEAALEIERHVATEERRVGISNRLYEIPIEREIILGRIADLEPPMIILAD